MIIWHYKVSVCWTSYWQTCSLTHPSISFLQNIFLLKKKPIFLCGTNRHIQQGNLLCDNCSFSDDITYSTSHISIHWSSKDSFEIRFRNKWNGRRLSIMEIKSHCWEQCQFLGNHVISYRYVECDNMFNWIFIWYWWTFLFQ
jgi:hypothetical protein